MFLSVCASKGNPAIESACFAGCAEKKEERKMVFGRVKMNVELGNLPKERGGISYRSQCCARHIRAYGKS